MHLSRAGKVVFWISVVWCTGSVVFLANQTPLLKFLYIPFTLAFFVTMFVGIVLVFTDWRRHSWGALLPLASCAVAVVLIGILAQAAREQLRQKQFAENLPAYEKIVREIENGSIPVSAKLERMSEAAAKAPLAYAVLAVKETNGILSVEFLTEAGFPLKHGGYLYVSSGIIAPGSVMDERWPMRQRVRTKWFYIRD